jgi:hypothetical protein
MCQNQSEYKGSPADLRFCNTANSAQLCAELLQYCPGNSQISGDTGCRCKNSSDENHENCDNDPSQQLTPIEQDWYFYCSALSKFPENIKAAQDEIKDIESRPYTRAGTSGYGYDLWITPGA